MDRAEATTNCGMYERWGKRSVDILTSAIALMVLSPLIVAVALLIKLFDPGPIIFRQKRVGKDGRDFDFFKFRSMPVGTKSVPSDQVGTVRLTWIGGLIRRSNLDELPQLWLILVGRMSLIGPRPPLRTQVELIELRQQNGALRCRPGLTGLAQVNSFNGMSVAEKAAYDGVYARKISLWGDVLIVLKTFLYLLRPPPVY
jgi:O-antigen biosynthesis protein WbqP